MGHAAAWDPVRDRLLVMSGSSQFGAPRDDLFAYYPANASWVTLPKTARAGALEQGVGAWDPRNGWFVVASPVIGFVGAYPGFAEGGRFTSPALLNQGIGALGTPSFVWGQQSNSNFDGRLMLRSGSDGVTWSAWETVNRTGPPVTTAALPYLQWQVELNTTDGMSTPTASEVRIPYTVIHERGSATFPPVPIARGGVSPIQVTGFLAAEQRGGQVDLSVSADDEVTWWSIGPGAPGQLPLNSSMLRFRLTIAASPSGSTPAFYNGGINYSMATLPRDVVIGVGSYDNAVGSPASPVRIDLMPAMRRALGADLDSGTSPMDIPVSVQSRTGGRVVLSELHLAMVADEGPAWPSNVPPSVDLLTPARDAVVTTPSLEFAWDGTDVDNDPLTYRLTVRDDFGIEQVFDTAATRFVVGNLTHGGEYRWWVIPSDPSGPGPWSDTFRFEVRLPQLNRPPEVRDISIGRLAGDPAAFMLEASDPDGDPLNYSLADGTPDAFLARDGYFFWVPPGPGFYEVVYQVSDGNHTVDGTIWITVELRPPPPDPPPPPPGAVALFGGILGAIVFLGLGWFLYLRWSRARYEEFLEAERWNANRPPAAHPDRPGGSKVIEEPSAESQEWQSGR